MQQLPEWMQQKKIEPEAANQIVLNLQAWHNDEPPPPFPQRQDVTQACIAQRRYGWRRFMDGFWAKEWEEIQAQYMLQNHNKKSARNLISLLQRRIWQIPWELWEHRNNELHQEGDRTHRQETTDLNNIINQEWERGRDTLPQRYNSLFNTTRERLLEALFFKKQQWIASVWVARQHHDGFVDLPPDTNTMVKTFSRWMKRTALESESESEEED